jgi:hypothetical protein
MEDGKPLGIVHVPPPTSKPPQAVLPVPLGSEAPLPPAGPGMVPAKSVDMLRLDLTIVQLLYDLCAEMRYATPSHTWNNMPDIWNRVGKLRKELEELTK